MDEVKTEGILSVIAFVVLISLAVATHSLVIGLLSLPLIVLAFFDYHTYQSKKEIRKIEDEINKPKK
jgi:hypothetical protein